MSVLCFLKVYWGRPLSIPASTRVGPPPYSHASPPPKPETVIKIGLVSRSPEPLHEPLLRSSPQELLRSSPQKLLRSSSGAPQKLSGAPQVILRSSSAAPQELLRCSLGAPQELLRSSSRASHELLLSSSGAPQGWGGGGGSEGGEKEAQGFKV